MKQASSQLDLRPSSEAANPQSFPAKKKFSVDIRWRSPWLIGACVIFIAGISLTWLHIASTTPDPFPVAAGADFPIYFPATLPHGYSLLNKSATFADDILLFDISGPGGRSVSVSEQAKPGSYDFSQIQGSESFLTSVGSATIGFRDSYSSASLLSDQTWVLLRANKPVTASDLETIVKGFKPAK